MIQLEQIEATPLAAKMLWILAIIVVNLTKLMSKYHGDTFQKINSRIKHQMLIYLLGIQD